MWKKYYKLLLVILLIRTLLLVGSYLHFRSHFLASDTIWFWMVWGVIDNIATFIIFPIYLLLMKISPSQDIWLLLLHGTVATLYWWLVLIGIYRGMKLCYQYFK